MSKHRALSMFSAAKTLERLRPFQRDAVEHAFHRLFVADNSTRRFLVADEVGLGKTMIARGIIAKAIEHMRDKVKRIDIVYLCSNQSIARQNLAKLNVLGADGDWQGVDRITLLPTCDLGAEGLNLVSLTPGTSLAVKSSMGAQRERQLLYAMLESHWNLSGKGPLNVLQGSVVSKNSFRSAAKDLIRNTKLSEELLRQFCAELDSAGAIETAAGRPDLKTRFLRLCDDFQRARKHIPDDQRREQRQVIGELRAVLAHSCIAALEPDLVILDEFQRFKHLLNPGAVANEDEREAAELANQLFNWSRDDEQCRVLLLSATPYKAYTLAQEEAEDNHYEDFLRTVEFLDPDVPRHQSFCTNLSSYGQLMYDLSETGWETIAARKADIESHLNRVMSRTERIPATQKHDAMLGEHSLTELHLLPDELVGYTGLSHISEELGQRDIVDYWASAPYPLNFMEDYQIKQLLKSHLADCTATSTIATLLRKAQPHFLNFARIEAYQAVSFANSRLRALAMQLSQSRAWELLWVPPSLPRYQLIGPFREAANRGFTKQLIFSAWQVVPKSIATLLSFEAERRAFVGDNSTEQSLIGARERQTPLLRIAADEGRLAGMPVLGLIYPSRTLCDIGSASLAAVYRADQLPTLDDVLATARVRVAQALPSSITFAVGEQRADDTWYWAAALMLDLRSDRESTLAWWRRQGLHTIWSGVIESKADSDAEAIAIWSKHIDEARRVLLEEAAYLGPAPNDLAEVLARLAIAGPAVCALRALRHVIPSGDGVVTHSHLDAAGQIGWSFRRLFNRPESIAIVRAGEMHLPYWRQLLAYCANGGLTSLLDEYAHILRDAIGAYDRPAEQAAPRIAEEMADALSLRVTNSAVDQFVFDDVGKPTLVSRRMRSLFAMRFGSRDTDEANEIQRGDQVRKAFNSPFWPFVLASTSVGQEGLDFHNYCHAVWHWNLPSNPVDMEQREGRVHRYKGHAVRKNVARAHGLAGLSRAGEDAWAHSFAAAKAEAPADDRGLVPCWIYPIENGAVVQRIVPCLPLSKDAIRHQALLRSIGAYRLVFGQPRQDDLLAYLLDRVDPALLDSCRELLQINLAPPQFAEPASA